MTDLVVEADPLDTVTPQDDDVIHLVCGVGEDAERTVPMYAICGADVTFDKMYDEYPEEKQCEECHEVWPQHLLKCDPLTECRIPLPH